MKVIHTIATVGPGSFGLGPVAAHLAKEQARLNVDAKVWSQDTEEDAQWALEARKLDPEQLRTFGALGPKILRLSWAMRKEAINAGAKNNLVIHQHGIWNGVSLVAQGARKHSGVPTIVAPHGSLEAWALHRSKAKKAIALAIYERENLTNANCLHACSEQEIAAFRDFGLKNPIAVIPNGIDEEWIAQQGDAIRFRKEFSIPSEKRILLFMSRITPVKGLLFLIEALNKIRSDFEEWILVIAGADEFGHRAEVKRLIDKHNLQSLVRFTGTLFGQIKRDAFAASDFFVLPTKREAAPVVVLEALGAAIPVLTTQGAPWAELETHGCGWWVGVSVEAIAAGLQVALSCAPDQLSAMGVAGRGLIAEKYIWTRSAVSTIELYKWLLGERERPDYVIVD